MPEVIDFQEALERTDLEDRAILIGNGFSAQYFSYGNLLEKSGLETGSSLRSLFDGLETVDFEAVVRALEGATIVERAYGNKEHADELKADAQQVREALVKAIHATHPTHREDLGTQYVSSAKFLEQFSTVFTLNYDLLLYWVNLENRQLNDGFGLGKQMGSFFGPFSESAYCQIYNLHGGLHLFDNDRGEIIKAVDKGAGVIATITSTISSLGRFPIYVAEGTKAQKLRKINTVPYLRHCYETLRGSAAAMFVYGHSADENDAHIYRAIFESKANHLFFGVYQPTKQRLLEIDGLLAKYQRTSDSTVQYTLFDSESAKVWDV